MGTHHTDGDRTCPLDCHLHFQRLDYDRSTASVLHSSIYTMSWF